MSGLGPEYNNLKQLKPLEQDPRIQSPLVQFVIDRTSDVIDDFDTEMSLKELIAFLF